MEFFLATYDRVALGQVFPCQCHSAIAQYSYVIDLPPLYTILATHQFFKTLFHSKEMHILGHWKIRYTPKTNILRLKIVPFFRP